MNGILEAKTKAEKSRLANERTAQTGASNVDQPDPQDSVKKKPSPMGSIFAGGTASDVPVTKARAERRKQRRASVKLLVRLRPEDRNNAKFEEVLGTLNASRANLYVITTSKSYYKLMRLRVTFPYDSAYDNLSTQEDTAEVVRLDHLPGDRTGVAIQLQRPIDSPSNNAAAGSDSAKQPNKEQRFAIRHTFSAAASMIEVDSRIRLQARCSDLSVTGCYIDTLNPFLKGSKILVQLTSRDVDFVAIAYVISHHPGMGMGLAFDGLRQEQKSVLADGLSQRPVTAEAIAEELPTSRLRASSQAHDSSDRAILMKLLSMLESKGKLVPF